MTLRLLQNLTIPFQYFFIFHNPCRLFHIKITCTQFMWACLKDFLGSDASLGKNLCKFDREGERVVRYLIQQSYYSYYCQLEGVGYFYSCMGVSPNMRSLNKINCQLNQVSRNYIKLSLMDEQEKQYFTRFVSPANPIITKKISPDQSNNLKFQPNHPSSQNFDSKNPLNNNRFLGEDLSDDEIQGRVTLFNAYPRKSLAFQKWDNENMRKRGKKSYFSSVFTNLGTWPEGGEVCLENGGIRFSSKEESMNLYAVYQIGADEYDLILQNDVNTSGYTQWFHFAVHNTTRNKKVKFNIVNLYKTKSLYSHGMKPVALSKKKGNGWQRAGTSISYIQNQINFEYSSRFYYTLSFEHTFLSEKDTTVFAHCYPYTLADLKQRMKTLEQNSRVHIRNIGQTSLKKNIPIIEFSQQDSNPNKKAIVIMARQHPGQTVGSHIMDQILTELTLNSSETQFLLWRFNIYCIPIVNIDGVELGNYRGNSFGFDLNRSWDRDNISKLPEISCIKREIKRIQKKYPIELMLDLHGHSRKMGSFFYGNPFGKNTGLFAFIASKTSPNISFENSTFHKEKTDKISTARVVLGQIIKESGSFYTYETSFFGSNLNGKKTHFTVESLRDLGKNLISAAAKTFLEIQKQEKSLKESIYLKEVRKQMTKMKESDGQSSCSDSEAQILTMSEMKIKNEEIIEESASKCKKTTHEKKLDESRKNQSVEIQVGTDDLLFVEQQKIVKRENVQTSSKSSFRRNNLRLRLGNSSEKYGLHVGFQKNEDSFVKENGVVSDPLNRKHFLMQKLRVFGQTFIEPNPKDKNKETQTGDPLNIMGKNNFASLSREQSPMKASQYRKKRKNKSLILKVDNREKLGMADIVKVNRLQYKKIKRQSINEISSKAKMKYQLLPIIN